MQKSMAYFFFFMVGMIMILLFILTYDSTHLFGRILFGVSLALWPILMLGVAIYNLLFTNDHKLKNILTKSLFMPILGSIVMVSILYLIYNI